MAKTKAKKKTGKRKKSGTKAKTRKVKKARKAKAKRTPAQIAATKKVIAANKRKKSGSRAKTREVKKARKASTKRKSGTRRAKRTGTSVRRKVIKIETTQGDVVPKANSGVFVARVQGGSIVIEGNAVVEVPPKVEKAGKVAVRGIWWEIDGVPTRRPLSGKKLYIGPVYVIK